MSFKNLAGLLTLAFIFTGCQTVPGRISVFEDFMYRLNGQDRYVPAGEYKATLKFRKKINRPRQAILNIKTPQGPRTLYMRVPRRIPTNQDNGTFWLRSRETGQPFDVKTTVKTRRTRSRSYVERRRCTTQVRRRVCTRPRPGQRPVCRIRYVQASGVQRVNYHYVNTNRKWRIGIFDELDQYKTASFSAGQQFRKKVINSRGACRVTGRPGRRPGRRPRS